MSELLQSGLTITAIGMGVVFVLLTLLVWIIQGMSALAAVLSGAPAPTAAIEAPPRQAERPLRDDELIAVIAAAVSVYRRSRQSN